MTGEGKYFCKRCGAGDEAYGEQRVSKCPECVEIRFEREELEPVLEGIERNYLEVREDLDFLTGFYVFGSFTDDSRETVGDVDVLVTYSEGTLSRYAEQNLKRFRENAADKGREELAELLRERSIHWDLRKCREYPDCLTCFRENVCDEPPDYGEYPQTYCLEECGEGDPVPLCVHSDCPWVEWSHVDMIVKDVSNLLTEGVETVREVGGREVKVLDLSMRESLDAMLEELDQDSVFTRIAGY